MILWLCQENPGRGEKQCIEEEDAQGQARSDDLEDDDFKPQQRRRAATASQVKWKILSYFV